MEMGFAPVTLILFTDSSSLWLYYQRQTDHMSWKTDMTIDWHENGRNIISDNVKTNTISAENEPCLGFSYSVAQLDHLFFRLVIISEIWMFAVTGSYESNVGPTQDSKTKRWITMLFSKYMDRACS